MKTVSIRDLVFLFVGLLVGILALTVYWQTNKQELARKFFGAVAVDKRCVLDLDTIRQIEEKQEADQEIYFVGCGGFF